MDLTQTAQTASAAIQAGPNWWHIVLGVLFGWLAPKVAQKVTPAQIAAVEAGAAKVAPVAEAALTVTGHPETAALVQRVVTAAQAAGVARAALAANQGNSAEQAAHQAASTELVAAAVAVAQAPK